MASSTTISPLTVSSSEEDESENPKKVNPNSHIIGIGYTLISTSSFSLATTLLKLNAGKWHPFTVGLVAFPVSTIFFIPFLLYELSTRNTSTWRGIYPLSSNKCSIFFIIIRTLLSSIIPFVLIWSLQYISVGDMRTILAASVISVYFLGWVCLGEECGLVPSLAGCLALVGIGVMTRPPVFTGADHFDEQTLKGVSIAILAMLMVTGILLTLRRLQNVNQAVLNFVLYFYASLQSLGLCLIFGKVEELSTAGREDILKLGSVGLLWAVGNLCLVLALQTEEAGIVGLVRTSEVVFTFGWQWILLGLPPDGISICGATLVLGGVITVILRKYLSTLQDDNGTKKALACLLK